MSHDVLLDLFKHFPSMCSSYAHKIGHGTLTWLLSASNTGLGYLSKRRPSLFVQIGLVIRGEFFTQNMEQSAIKMPEEMAPSIKGQGAPRSETGVCNGALVGTRYRGRYRGSMHP